MASFGKTSRFRIRTPTYDTALYARRAHESARCDGVVSARLDIYPDVPTINEAGLPGHELMQWYALLAPAKTPPEIITSLNTVMRNALPDTDVKKKE